MPRSSPQRPGCDRSERVPSEHPFSMSRSRSYRSQFVEVQPPAPRAHLGSAALTRWIASRREGSCNNPSAMSRDTGVLRVYEGTFQQRNQHSAALRAEATAFRARGAGLGLAAGGSAGPGVDGVDLEDKSRYPLASPTTRSPQRIKADSSQDVAAPIAPTPLAARIDGWMCARPRSRPDSPDRDP
jgi:hypothetical protein